MFLKITTIKQTRSDFRIIINQIFYFENTISDF